MKTKILNFSIICLMILSIFMISCDGDDEINPDEDELDIEDNDIPLDDGSVFNMANFILSWDQMFVGSSRWAWDFDHETEDGRVVKSYQNYKVYGEYGANYFEIQHEYDSDGVLISSSRTSNFSDSENSLKFEYEFDEEGMVVLIKKFSNSQLREYTELTYNADKQLIQKDQFDDDGIQWAAELFEYDADNNVINYLQEDVDGDEYEIDYEYNGSGNMVLRNVTDRYNGETYTRSSEYEYDSQNRIVKEIYRSDDYEYTDEITYEGDEIVVEGYQNGRISSINRFGPGFTTLEVSEFLYDENDDFKARIDIEVEDDNYVKYSYFGGSSISNVSFIGHADVIRDSFMNIESKEFYDVNGNLIYVFDYESYIWYDANGNEVFEYDITEEWVLDIQNNY